MSHSVSDMPRVGPPSHMPWQHTMMRCVGGVDMVGMFGMRNCESFVDMGRDHVIRGMRSG